MNINYSLKTQHLIRSTSCFWYIIVLIIKGRSEILGTLQTRLNCSMSSDGMKGLHTALLEGLPKCLLVPTFVIFLNIYIEMLKSKWRKKKTLKIWSKIENLLVAGKLYATVKTTITTQTNFTCIVGFGTAVWCQTIYIQCKNVHEQKRHRCQGEIIPAYSVSEIWSVWISDTTTANCIRRICL